MRGAGLRWRAAAVAGVVACLWAAAAPVQALDVDTARAAWLRNRAAMAETAANLEDVSAETDAAAATYEEVTTRLDSAHDRLRELDIRLRDAVRRQRAAEAANDVAIQRLGQATLILVTIEESLRDHAAALETEVVAAYKYGGSSAQFNGIVNALLTSGSVTEFTSAYEQLRTAAAGQGRVVDAVSALAERGATQRTLVEVLQGRTAEAERVAEGQRRRVAALTAQQRELVAGVAADRRRQRRLLARLEQQHDELQLRAEELQAQSERLVAELGDQPYVGGLPGGEDLLWPTDGPSTSGFGYRSHPILDIRRLHAGIDIPAPTGQSVYAVADGIVSSAGPRGGYGNAVVIDHGEGMTSVYAHLSQIDATTGQRVTGGLEIGAVGSTGLSTGPHLHFEIRLGGVPVDPLDWY